MTAFLAELHQVILSRLTADPDLSHTAKLFAGGRDRILKKVGEESAEFIIAAKNGNKQDIVHESADLLYHFLVALAELRVDPAEVMDELKKRQNLGGAAPKPPVF